jgi:hypothetical protein
MAGAIENPLCLVAVCGGEVVAALDFGVQPDHVEAGMLGSRQTVRGAALALELALAEEAADRGIAVRGEYRPAARGFHESIGRRLDLESGRRTSEWTADDCRFIVEALRTRT